MPDEESAKKGLELDGSELNGQKIVVSRKRKKKKAARLEIR